MKLHTLSVRDALAAMQTTEEGLSEKEAKVRLSRHGYNELSGQKPRSLLSRFAEQFNDFMILILLGAALISFLTSLFEGKADFAEPLIILFIVLMNAVLGVVQEAKERAMLIDASYGRKTKAVILMDTDHVILSAMTPDTLFARWKGEEKQEEQ